LAKHVFIKTYKNLKLATANPAAKITPLTLKASPPATSVKPGKSGFRNEPPLRGSPSFLFLVCAGKSCQPNAARTTAGPKIQAALPPFPRSSGEE
jgi:hypothetical protein